MDDTVSTDVSERLQVSYGFWTELAMMLSQKEFLGLQSLNKRAYNVDVGRVQTRFLLKNLDFCAFAVCRFGEERHSLFTCNMKALKFRRLENFFDFSKVNPIFVDGSLYCFEEKRPVTVVRFDNVDMRNKLRRTDLTKYPDPRL